MAYVLSLPSTNPLERPFTDPLHMRSCSSFASQASLGTVRHQFPRSVSATSVRSISSIPSVSRRRNDENAAPRLASRSLLNLIHDLNSTTAVKPARIPTPQQTSWCSTNPPYVAIDLEEFPPLERASAHIEECGHVEEAWHTPCDSTETDTTSTNSTDGKLPSTRMKEDDEQDVANLDDGHAELDDHTDDRRTGAMSKMIPDNLPFKRWLSTLRRKNHHRCKYSGSHLQLPHCELPLEVPLFDSPAQHSLQRSGHGKSLSLTSSLGLITAVKSASMTLTGTSIAAISRIGTRRGDNRSSVISEVRMSFDSTAPSLEPVIDERAWARSVQRRMIVEEILSSEESYVVDMKALVNVYFTLLATMPSMTLQRRKNIQRSVTQIVELHEELSAELHKIVPNSEATQDTVMQLSQARKSRHLRWHSAENAPSRPNLAAISRRFRHSIDASRPADIPIGSPIGNTSIVLNVAKVFDRFIARFLTYEAYVANNEVMADDASSTSRIIPTWPAYERGVEALTSSTNSIHQYNARNRKGLTFSDLLIKPIQRILKYSLFFEDLCKQTPACDDPVAHSELEKVLFRLKETGVEIDNATDNPRVRQLIETTWILQDRLVFGNERCPDQTMIPRQLGHVVLCGVLHVAHDTNSGVKGQYTICILYRSSLVLALARKGLDSYDVIAVISLISARIEQPDNGRGLQCHTAPYTWKVLFECKHRQYEVIMSACSELEEEEWKCHLRFRMDAETRDVAEGRADLADLFISLPSDIKSLGTAFEAYSGFTRRKPIYRAATLGTKTNLHQVIIKNTHAQRPGNDESESFPLVARSQSHLSSGHIPILAPRRAERIRLEIALTDVWSRDVLPYPGMASRRPDNPIRASANSVMRKLSMASIASNFSKRSTSFAAFNTHRLEEPRLIPLLPIPAPPPTRPKRTLVKRHCPNSPALVDFHNAPSAFLPEDFELKQPKVNSRQRRLSTRAGTNERSVTPQPMIPIRLFLEKSQESQNSRIPTITESPSVPQTPPSERSSSPSIATVVHTPVKEELSSPLTPRAHHALMKGPTKARSILFKLLGVTRDRNG